MYDDEYSEESTFVEKIKGFFISLLSYTSFINIKGSTRKFTDTEQKLMIHLFTCYSKFNPKVTSWLFTLIDLNKIRFRWNFKMGETGIMGQFTPMSPKSIYVSDNGFFAQREQLSPVDNSEQNLSTYKERRKRRNDISLLLGTLCMAFPTLIHEMVHMFQCGIACVLPEDSIWKDWVLFKIILPTAFVFNRLITLFIDNPIVDKIMISIKKTDDPWCDTDKIHIPILYKFTMEHDADESSENDPLLIEFSETMQLAISAVDWLRFNDPNSEDMQRRFEKYTEEEKALAFENYDRMVETYNHDIPTQFLQWARELIAIGNEI